MKSGDSQSSGNGGWWMFVIFAALGVGFGSSYWFVERDGAYLLVAIITGVIALGSLLITIFGRK